MQLRASNISCGVSEIMGVGTKPSDAEFDNIMRQFDGAILIASVPTRWKNAVKFLKRKGFKQTHRQITNPNTDNKIALFARNVTEKEKREYRANECNYCAAELPRRRRVCDECKRDNRNRNSYDFGYNY